MPEVMSKVRGGGTHKGHGACYRVKNKNTGQVHAKCSSKSNAKKQMRLLHAIDHGWHPTHGPRR